MKPFIIAEAGKNFIDHDWKKGAKTVPYYAERAIALIKVAKQAGADAVKFQTHVFEDEQLMRSEKRYDWIKFNESITPFSFWKELRDCCDRIGIEFMTTPMSKMAAERMDTFVKRWKIGSGNVTDIELLKYVASTKKPVILSTGMSTQKQVEDAIDILKDSDLSLLYCKSIYPCPIMKVDFTKIKTMQDYFHFPVGFSDHTTLTYTSEIAIKYGATIIEKHFTMDKNAVGPDHRFSLSPDELIYYVSLAKSYGDIIIPDLEETAYWKDFRKVA